MMTKARQAALFLCMMVNLAGVSGLTNRALAQSPRRGDQFQDRFKQLDRNDDGKLSAEEVAQMPSLARLLPVADTDKDAALSRDEIRAASKKWPALAGLLGGAAGEEKKPASTQPRAAGATARRIPPNTRPIDPKWGPDIEPKETTLKFTFQPDYLPGTKDVNGEVFGARNCCGLPPTTAGCSPLSVISPKTQRNVARRAPRSCAKTPPRTAGWWMRPLPTTSAWTRWSRRPSPWTPPASGSRNP